MSDYYTPRRTRNLYDPDNTKPFKLSRSKIDLFLECPRCFYLDRRLGVGRPPGFPFAINSAVDALLKQEFDMHRKSRTPHPLIERYGIDARPAPHEYLDKWRQNATGVQYFHEPTGLLIFGAIDDLWINSRDEYIVVDYKATAKAERITVLDKDWHGGYKRQMEIYQWLLRRNGLTVSKTGYFVYCNAQADRGAFDGKLEFDITVIPHTGNSGWVEDAIQEVHRCLSGDHLPDASEDCDYCAYRDAVEEVMVK